MIHNQLLLLSLKNIGFHQRLLLAKIKERHSWKKKKKELVAMAPLLTVVVDGEGHVGRDDVIEADLAVLRGAVGVQGLDAHHAVEQAALGHRRLVPTLHEHRGELVDVVDAHVNRRPGRRRGGQETHRGDTRTGRGVRKHNMGLPVYGSMGPSAGPSHHTNINNSDNNNNTENVSHVGHQKSILWEAFL